MQVMDLTILNNLTISCDSGETLKHLDCFKLASNSSAINEEMILILYDAKQLSNFRISHSNYICDAFEVVNVNGNNGLTIVYNFFFILLFPFQ